MASLEEMLKAGYTPEKTGTQQIAALLNASQQSAKAQDAKKVADQEGQVKLYMTLRDAGYSPEDATARVTRSYRSTDFIQNLLTGKNDNAFVQPGGEDKTALDRKKTEADIENTKADVKLKTSKSNYYDAGGPKRSVIDKMTPNQLQARIKYLESVKGTLETAEENADVDQELAYVNAKVQEISGYKKPGTEAPAGDAGTIRVKRLADGKTGTIPAKNFDTKKYVKI